MPAPMTELQVRFAFAYVSNGGDVKAAAIEAGYSEKSAADLGYRALALPHVQEMILRELIAFKARAGVAGLSALMRIAKSETAPPAAVVSAGRALVEYAGLVGLAADGDGRRRLHETPAPDYKAILDTFANISALAVAARRETIQ